MAVVVLLPLNAVERHMATPASTIGKRKAPVPLPRGAQVIDLTSSDDEVPAPKRQKSDPAHEILQVPSRTRDLSTPKPQQYSIVKWPLDDNDLFHKESETSKLSNPLPPLKQSPFGKPSSRSLTAQKAGLNGSDTPRREKDANGKIERLRRGGSPARSIPFENPNGIASNLRELVDSEKLRFDRSPEGYAIYSNTFRDTGAISKASSAPENERQEVQNVFRLGPASSIKFDPQVRSSSSQPNISSDQNTGSYCNNGVVSRDLSQRQLPQETKNLDISEIKQSQNARRDSLPYRQGTPSGAFQRLPDDSSRKQLFSHVEINNSKLREGPAKKQLIREMQKGIDAVRDRVGSIERLFGLAGFSEMYNPTSDDKTQLKQLLQSKAKKVRRKKVQLDWGAGSSQPTHEFDREDLAHPRDQLMDLSKATVLSLGSAAAPLTFTNNIDDRKMNGKFQFVSDYVYRDNISARGRQMAFDVGCSIECRGNCLPETCGCLRNDRLRKLTYRERDEGLIVLSDEFLAESQQIPAAVMGDEAVPAEKSLKSEIVECNEYCRCGPDCMNRLVQRGRTLPIEIFMTPECGFGLRSSKPIVRGQFIDRYLGELITETTLQQRENATLFNEPSYVFSLDWFKKDNGIFHIDGRNFGSPVRFVNHSCNANCGIFPVMLNQSDNRIYGLAFFAIKDIPSMTELTLDYSPDSLPEKGEIDDAMIRCKCGESDCKGWLWPKNLKKSTRRGL